jgi:dephospho-CoA kinase
MKIAKRILEKLKAIQEKLIIVNKNKKEGQIVILAGGAGSGKGFTINTFMDSSSYKVFDVDRLKELLINKEKRKLRLSDGKEGNQTLADLNLKKPEDVFKLHTYVDQNNLADKQFSNFLMSIANSKSLPNIILDVTLKSLGKVSERLDALSELGYKPENTHIIWVLADYEVAVRQNQERDRVVPDDIVFQTHSGAATNMRKILSGALPNRVDGELYVVFSDKRLTVPRKEPVVKGDKVVVKDFLYSKVKDAGSSIKSEDEIKKDIFFLAKEMVPKEVKALFT